MNYEEKRQLLKLVLQNCKLKGKKLQFTMELWKNPDEYQKDE